MIYIWYIKKNWCIKWYKIILIIRKCDWLWVNYVSILIFGYFVSYLNFVILLREINLKEVIILYVEGVF